ncbi:MAG: TonB-dependent receptor [Candidatus Marinimicrobia bacterium]|nr:TonB-dependent receptor [Candidatus Neomarinimicrobiota bacterium]MBT4795665.1 TonB-dependent receptor [Candidatus Neomarinimicrobiota bacterium]MBT5339459.1 TonB-dependent receptor [Candidatus Neomarinimicrobiota bacterium]MBT5999927.1 TonB-dependent receptor [Candidatus Neomarinimicrobiota bacterium]MBT6196019.1 TonB-dependent receptor [Candidatus Neomarinimicrobiota bacterium]
MAQKGTISGSINDANNGDPLLGANVIIKETSQGASTDTDGHFTISRVNPGNYTLIVTYIGYQTLKNKLDLGDGETINVELTLEPEAIQMETYVVTASRRRERVEDAPAAISVISKKEIRRESNTNLGSYLKGVKGIDFTQSGIDSYNMTARGFNSSFSSRLLTLTDGRMANVPSLRLTAYNVIPVSFEDVEQIEVVLGPSSALYGPNAHSGVLNIVTSSPIRTQGTSINIQGGWMDQTDADLLKKITFRTAHKVGNFGFKISGVALAGKDWVHFNEDEWEGHDPVFIGRPNLKHDRLDRGGIPGENGNQMFTYEMINEVDDADESWVGFLWGDKIATAGGEAGSPLITQEMVDKAASDAFNRFTLDNRITLWFVTADKIGKTYADGIDNNGDGAIDEGIDLGIDDESEAWYDGVDNDGDGEIDEADEIGSSWLDRFGSYYQGTDASTHKFGFGDYKYDSEGNLIFDTNDNGQFGDNWGSDGLDNDDDWGPFKDDMGNTFDVPYEPFVDLNNNGLFDADVGEIWVDIFGNQVLLDYGLDGIPGTGDYGEGNGVWDGESFDDLNNNDEWDDSFDNNDLDGDGLPSQGELGVDEFDEMDFSVNYGDLPQKYMDANDDGINDYPTFNVRNYRYDMRLDWEPNSDLTVSLSHGFAWARNINITGIARYLADGWVYRYYQARIRWKNFFLQTYLNSSYSGDPSHPTRNLATGSLIYDRSKKFSAQLQHVNEWKDGNIRFVWGLDYFLTLPDTRGTILSDKNYTDNRDNNGTGESGSPYIFHDINDNTWYEDGEAFSKWATDNGTATGALLDSTDAVLGAIADGLDNDGDSDDFTDLNSNGIPDFLDSDGSGEFEFGETVEPGVRWLGGQRFIVYADGLDNDGDGLIDENIDEGIDEAAEDNRYTVNEIGAYYQVNWKFSKKWEFIQATRFDVHDRLSDMIEFNNQGEGMGYNPLDWKFDFSKTDGLQVSPKIGLVYRPMENQNFRLTWATAFNTPSNQALFLDIYVTRVSIFKVYARGADGGYNFPRDSQGNPYYYDIDRFTYLPIDTSNSILFYPSTDPRIDGFYGQTLIDLPEIEPETVRSWEFGYKGRLNNRLFGTLDIYTSHFSSFVSPVTFITPIVIEKSILERDYDGDGLNNTIDELEKNNIIDQDDYDESFNHWRGGIQGITAMDTTPGFTPPVVVGYLNYGEVDMWGLDASLVYFINPRLNLDLTYSFLGMTEFFNPITKGKDPINAPRNKAGMKLQYNLQKWPITTSLNARYVDGFKWSSGIYFGDIKPYTIFDLHIGYKINNYATANLSISNLLDNKHTEIIGGPSLGRVIVLRLQNSF